MSTVDLLKAARARIEKPEAWTQGVFARADNGSPINPENKFAACWCIRGAAAAACEYPEVRVVEAELQETIDGDWLAVDDEGAPNLPEWNDEPCRTHAQVLNLFDRTIARLEAQ